MLFQTRYVLVECPEYFSCLDEYRNGADQMMVLHCDVNPDRFSAKVLRRIKHEFQTLRAVTAAPIFAIEPRNGDDKWTRWMAHFGFSPSSTVDLNGETLRVYLSTR